MEKGRKTNKILTILLIIGTVTVFFPLYMAVIIAFKNPNEVHFLCRKAGVFPTLQKQCK